MQLDVLPLRQAETREDVIQITDEQVHGVVSSLINLLCSVDKNISQDSLTNLSTKFEGHFQVIQGELHAELEGSHDTVVLQYALMRAKQRLIDRCYSDILNYYGSNHPGMVTAIQSLKELQAASLGGAESISSGPAPHLRVQEPDIFAGFKKFFTLNFWIKYFLFLFPILKWLPKYDWARSIFGDLQAGFTVGFVVIPQGLSYSTLAGMPAVYGLYTAFLPPIIYALFGSSNEISVGPVALVSLTLPSILTKYAEPESDLYVNYAIIVALLSGAALLLAGLLRLGFLIENLISHPTMMGFTQGAATLIMFSQLKGLLSIPIAPSAKTLIDYAKELHRVGDQASYRNALFGLLVVIIVSVFRAYNNRVPMTFLMLVMTTFIAWAAQLQAHGFPLVGHIPSGIHIMPKLHADSSVIGDLLTGAVIIALLGFMETITVGRRFATMRHYRININNELVALGACNILGATCRSYPCTGSVSRTSENYWNNSRSPLNGVAVGFVIMCTLLFATSLFQWTPKCVLAAVVIAACAALIDWKATETRYLWKLRAYIDIAQIYIVWLGVLLLGPENGVLVAIAVTLIQVMYSSARPGVVPLGRLPGSVVYKDLHRFPDAQSYPGVLIVRFDARLAFFNISWFTDRLAKLEVTVPDLRVVIISATGINAVDSTATHALSNMVKAYEKRNIIMLWADTKGVVRDTLDASGLTEAIGRTHFFFTVHDAVEFARRKVRAKEKDRDLEHNVTDSQF